MSKSKKKTVKPIPRKTTKLEVERRVGVVAGFLERGHTRAMIVQFGAKEWKLEARQVDTYIARANEAFKEERKFDRMVEYYKNKQRYERIFLRAMDSGDLDNALRTLNGLCEYLGLKQFHVKLQGDPDQPIEVKHNHALESRNEVLKEILKSPDLRKKALEYFRKKNAVK